MRLFVSSLLVCAAAPLLLQAEATQWTIDPSHSSAQFSVRHLMVSTVRGQFGKVTGKVVYDAADLSKSSVEATVDASAIDTRDAKRDDHLRSADFFDVAKYPTMTFKSKSITAAGPGKLKMVGDLTMHGVTKEVTFDVEGPSPEVKLPRGAKSGATATGKINRKDFGITWNRALDAGGVTVGDEVSITIDVELNKVTQ